MNYIWLMSLFTLGYFIFKLVSHDDGISYRRVIGAYILWAFVNVIMWLMSEGDSSDFWPFDGFGHTDDYDISEFTVYVIGPLVYNFARNLMRSSNSDHEQIPVRSNTVKGGSDIDMKKHMKMVFYVRLKHKFSEQTEILYYDKMQEILENIDTYNTDYTLSLREVLNLIYNQIKKYKPNFSELTLANTIDQEVLDEYLKKNKKVCDRILLDQVEVVKIEIDNIIIHATKDWKASKDSTSVSTMNDIIQYLGKVKDTLMSRHLIVKL